MFNILSMNDNIALDVIRTIAAVFDKAIYWLISFAYNIILEIANIQIFSDAEIQSFAGRLYTLIGIFMLFKLSFSIISYIISPDTIFDKEKGGTKLLKNVVITFILIIIMPTVFNIMGKVQNAILNDNIIENFVLGTDGETSSKMFKIDEQCPVGNKIDNDGDYVALMIFRPFYQVDPNGRNPSDLLAGDYCSATSVPALLKYDIYNSPVAGAIGTGMSGNYNVDYWFIISAIIGGVVFVVLIGFAMDIAVRSIKLSFLQIISPIPIISYIDPNQSKNGIFKKWAKEVGKTWADLFIKLIALYFLLKLLTMIDSLSNITENSDYKLWVSILIIIGGLIFAKKLPTLIGNMLGIKLDGGFNINPLKKFEKEALGGKILTSAGGMTAGMLGGAVAGAAAGNAVGNIGKGIAAGILSGASYGRHNPKAAFSKSMDQAYKSLTGNEMARFSFTKFMMGGGEKEVGEIKGYLKMANQDLRAEETRLNIASKTSADMGTKLTAQGYNLQDLGSVRNDLSSQSQDLANVMNSTQVKINETRATLNSYNQKYNEAEAYVNNYTPTAYYDDGTPIYSSEYKEYKKFLDNYNTHKLSLENELQTAQQNYEIAKLNYDNNIESIKNIDSYLRSISTENESRARIQSINKTISTLSDEKKQREKFYRYDSSPKEDVNKAIEKAKTHNYE